MKKKILKILGVGLTLMLVFSLGAVFTASPVLADEDDWSAVDFAAEGEDGDWVWTDTINAGPTYLEIAINGDLWVYADVPSGEYHIFVSDDGGRTWTQTEFYDDTVAYETGTDKDASDVSDIACSSLDEDIVYVAAEDANTADWWVWKTDDGGDTWAIVNEAGMPDIFDGTDDEDISAIDVAYDSDDDPYVFWGTTDGSDTTGHVYYINEEGFGAGWTNLQLDGAAAGALEVFGLACSPDFENDGITAVLSVNSTATVVCTNYGVESEWDEVELLDNAATPISYVITEGSDPVFPEDFDEDDAYELFVGVVGAAHDGAEGGVYLVYGTDAGEFDLLDDVDQDIISLAGVGNQGSMFLVAGENENVDAYATVWYSYDDGESWDEADKGPNGTEAYVVMDADFDEDAGLAWAATATDSTQVGLVSGTVDAGVLWNGYSLFDYTIDDFTGIAAVASSPTTLFAVTADGTIDALWRTSDDGDTWDIVLQSTLADIEAEEFDMVGISPESSDVIYVGDTTEETIIRSTDGGDDWGVARNEPTALTSWVILDDETIIAGGNGTIYFTDRHGARAWDDYDVAGAGNIISFALSPAFDTDETIIAGDDTSEVYISEDYGETWDQVGGAIDTDTTNTYVGFDPGFANSASDGYNLIYAASDNTTSRFLDITELTDDWDDYSDAAPPDGHHIGVATGLIVASDGTLYVSDSDVGEGMARTVNPLDDLDDADATEWNTVGDAMGLDATGALEGLEITYGSSNILWSWDEDTTDVMGVWTYEDTLAGPITLRSPADAADSGSQDSCDVSWAGMDNADSYFIQWDTSADMDYDPDDEAAHETTNYTIGEVSTEELGDGTLYYWWVRVDAPVFSRFSDVRSFVTEMGGGEWNPFRTAEGYAGNVAPVPGASDVPLLPGFQWNSADWAVEYEFVLDDNADFSSPIESKTVTTPFASIDTALTYSTAYYWKVRAIGASGAESEWGQGTFTTMVAPAVAPTPAAPAAPPIIEIPPAAAAIAPQWIYAVIGIGAALMAVVIVLIVRTRKQ